MNDAQELYDKAAVLASSGRHAEAVGCYERVLRLNPSNPHIWFNMTHSIGHLGRHQDVVKTCERALKIHPTFSPLWILKGLGFMSMEQFHEAMDCFQKSENLGDASAVGHIEHCRKEHAGMVLQAGLPLPKRGQSYRGKRMLREGSCKRSGQRSDVGQQGRSIDGTQPCKRRSRLL